MEILNKDSQRSHKYVCCMKINAKSLGTLYVANQGASSDVLSLPDGHELRKRKSSYVVFIKYIYKNILFFFFICLKMKLAMLHLKVK